MSMAVPMILGFFVCVLAGFTQANHLSGRVKCLENIIHGISRLGSLMRCTRSPLNTLIMRIEGANDSAFWTQLADSLNRGKSFYDAYEYALLMATKSGDGFSNLTIHDKTIISAMATTLGRGDLDAELKNIDLFLDEIAPCLAEARNELVSKGKIYKSLGLMGGLAFAIILW